MLISKEKTYAPPLYMPVKTWQSAKPFRNKEKERKSAPSSGVIVRVNVSTFAGSGKCIFIVDVRSISVRSE